MSGRGTHGTQLRLVLWKNWILKKRQWRQAALEVAFPLYWVFLLWFLSTLVPSGDVLSTIVDLPEPPFPCDVKEDMECIAVAYTPEHGGLLDRLATRLSATLSVPPRTIRGFTDESQIQERYLAYPQHLWGAVVFIGNTDTAGPIHYSLRLNSSYVEGIEESYISSGFATLQTAVDHAIYQERMAFSDAAISVQIAALPKHAMHNPFSDIWGFYLILVFLPALTSLLVGIGTEKKTKLKETMKMMGLSDLAYWLGWFLSQSILSSLSVLLFVLCMYVARLFAYSNVFLVFVLFITFALSLTSLGCLISVFFDDPRKSGYFTSAFLIVAIVIFGTSHALLLNQPGHSGWKALVSLLCFVPVGEATYLLANAEGEGEGIQWNNCTGGFYPFTTSLLWLLVDAFLYLVLAWYADSILTESGKGLFFCFRPSYWRTTRRVGYERLDENEIELVGTGHPHGGEEEERVPVIHVRDLSKVFPAGCGHLADESKVAVNHLTLNLYEGEVFALLGHNGAGKTTTISMLTGLLAATDGTAFINDLNIRTHMPQIRRMLGVCPQQNTLFDALTASEHLFFFAGLKGVPWENIHEHVTQVMEDVGLSGEEEQTAGNLSGGTKRKLSVGIAIIGDSPILFLDEPTSGMDPLSRRRICDLLHRIKPNKMIVLTTHSMEEADVLGDRIGIMSRGVLKALGTSLQLKSRFGIGYHLRVSRGPTMDLAEEDAVTDMVVKEVPGSYLLPHQRGAELTYVLPLESVESFEEFFHKLEHLQESFKVEDYGIECTTMEEVFLRIAHMEEQGLDVDVAGLARDALPTE